MLRTRPIDALSQYEEKACALYFVNDIRYPYVSETLMSLVCVWLMYGKVSNLGIAIWVFCGVAVSLLREVFMWRMKPVLAQGRGHTVILRGCVVSSVLTGAVWGSFAWMYFDASDSLTLLVAGFYLAGHLGGAVTPLSIYLPAFYLFALPAILPYAWLLASAGSTMHLVLAGLSMLFLLSTSNFAHVTNRLHLDAIRLRFENQRLIADLEARNTEIEAASNNKSLFLAGVSHDLKQPIRAIAMYTGFLRHSKEQTTGRATVTNTAEKIDAAVKNIHSQINRLLELSRLESGAMPLHIEPLDLERILNTVRDLMATEAQSRGVQLRMALGKHREVWADRRMLDSILSNLVSNAIKHANNGTVYIGTRTREIYPAGQQLCIEVRDSGQGIPANRLPLLFDAYRSFDDRRGSESHGPGLAIAKAQASYLGCDIAVASKPGRGSTFTLCGLRTDMTTTPPTATESTT